MSLELPVINSSEPENVCLTKCTAACCKHVHIGVRDIELPLLLANSSFSKHMESYEELSMVSDNGVAALPGVYFIENGLSHFAVYIAGNCPNLTDDNECAIYETRPEACRTLEPGDSECTNMRRKYGLQPVFDTESNPRLISRVGSLIIKLYSSYKNLTV